MTFARQLIFYSKIQGPHWYSYTRVEDKVKSQYVGKRLPREVQRMLHKQNKTYKLVDNLFIEQALPHYSRKGA